MEDRAIRDYRFRKSTQQFLCLFVLLSVSSFADKPWLNKSSDNWDENDVIQILSDSPWVRKEAIRIVPSEERWYRESIFGLFGKEHLYWVRLTWLAEPVQKACELIEALSIVLRNDSEIARFLTSYRALEHWQDSSGQQLLNEENSLVVLQGDILSGLIGPHNQQDVQTASLTTEAGGQIELGNVLFGQWRPRYTRSEEGVKRALVEVEELAQDNLSRQPEADEIPLSTITYVCSVNNVDEVRSLLLVFPRDRLGDEDVTLKVPMGGKIGLTTKFRLSEMLVAGVRKF